MGKYVHLTNNVVDFEMEAHPSNVFGSPYADEFVFTDNGNVTTGWVFNGVGFTAPLPTAEVIPQFVQMWQARAVLEQAGYKAQIDIALANDVVARNKWEYATVVKRDDTLIASMAVLLSLTDKQVDQLFIEASKL